ncbi:NUDIX hydrolase [Nonlabens ulvanivorans]|uniref:NUDIX hydrolase n=1 Tax=Nonlabens ulvanivorans TaxID=906888 RepID=UPI002942AA8A|nr:NUDIX domain-containing protein [Nonlabens ulvanivorans]WOI21728.1 NUDIX domain-containing protein [Nonlabens ulvanivorans]
MAQMYKVFVKDVAIIVTSNRDEYPDYEVFSLKDVDLLKIIKKIEKGKLKKVLLYSKNEKKLLKRLHKKLPLVKAGGGLVMNNENKFLFIHRNGKWDLPKGKANRFEGMRKTAKREIEEETGAKKLKMIKKLGRTYHVFNRKSALKLKLTHWYLLETNYSGPLEPQAEEGIDIATWLDKSEAEKALESSYSNIKELFPDQTLNFKRR